MDYRLTIIVPVFNEEGNLLRLEKELGQYLREAIVPTKVLIVNDGSTDNSQHLINEICERNVDFDFVTFQHNAGLSAAIKAGFDYADTEFTGYIDSDLQTNPEDFNLLLAYAEDYELVTGVRADRKDPLLKRFSSKFANSFRKMFTHDGVSDTGCPLKIIRTSYAKKIPMFKGLHRFLPAMILLQKGKIKQVSVRHYPRIAGEAKFGFWNRIVGPLLDCFAYLWMKKKYINYEVIQK